MVETPHRRRRSHRRVRTRVYVEGPDGSVTEKAANVAAEGEREVWVQVGDAADSQTREDYADALLDLHSTPRQSIDVGVGGHAHQAYADYAPGDTVAAEGHDQMRTARAESITMRLGDQVDTDVTLTSRAQLQIEDLETLLERMGDASRAANPSLQKRHGLISADKIESGRIRVDQDIASSNFSSGSAGWQVRGNGNAEFNNVTVRGTVDASTISGSTLRSDDPDTTVNVYIAEGAYRLRDGTTVIGRMGAVTGGGIYLHSDDNVTISADADGPELLGAPRVVVEQSSGNVVLSPEGTGSIKADGDIEFGSDGIGPVLKSGDGSLWRIDVDNAGNLSTTSV